MKKAAEICREIFMAVEDGDNAVVILDVYAEERVNDALEEAAKVAESRITGSADDGLVVQSDIAATIRALKEKP